jgi:hypothetical protein
VDAVLRDAELTENLAPHCEICRWVDRRAWLIRIPVRAADRDPSTPGMRSERTTPDGYA